VVGDERREAALECTRRENHRSPALGSAITSDCFFVIFTRPPARFRRKTITSKRTRVTADMVQVMKLKDWLILVAIVGGLGLMFSRGSSSQARQAWIAGIRGLHRSLAECLRNPQTIEAARTATRRHHSRSARRLPGHRAPGRPIQPGCRPLKQ
jgi:hypothetical protein